MEKSTYYFLGGMAWRGESRASKRKDIVKASSNEKGAFEKGENIFLGVTNDTAILFYN